MIGRAATLWSLLMLSACGGGGGGGAAPAVTGGLNPNDYLAQSVNLDGDPTTPLRAADPITRRRFDFGRYQASDSYLTPDGSAITTWSYPPFGSFVAAHGDGGERYALQNGVVYITATQDGSAPVVTQFGSGWPLFGLDADANWRETLGNGLTRYSLRDVTYPVIGAAPSIVSEHYNGPTAASSNHMERFFMGAGWGRLVWQAWGLTPAPVDLSARCPDFGWNALPGWQLQDCREAVDVAPAPVPMTGAQEWTP